MKIPNGQVALATPEFYDVLRMVDGFHDGVIGCAYFDGGHEQMIFIELMRFVEMRSYNPKPVLGGILWFDLPVPETVAKISNWYGREIGRIEVVATQCLIKFQLQDEPFEAFEFKFGPDANFQFVTSGRSDVKRLE